MENPVPFSTVYFCGNCEEEIVGMPAGSRRHSRRPLCLRCTQIGQEEGWGEANQPIPSTRTYESTSKPGIIKILFLMIVTGIFVFLCSAIFNDRKN